MLTPVGHFIGVLVSSRVSLGKRYSCLITVNIVYSLLIPDKQLSKRTDGNSNSCGNGTTKAQRYPNFRQPYVAFAWNKDLTTMCLLFPSTPKNLKASQGPSARFVDVLEIKESSLLVSEQKPFPLARRF